MKGQEIVKRHKAGERDFSEVDLSGAYLRQAKLPGADLRWAKLPGADLRKANLSGAKLGESLRYIH